MGKQRTRLAALATVLAGLVATGAAGAVLDREVVAGEMGRKLDELAGRYAAWGFSGTVLVAEGDEILLHKGYGLADREAGVPSTVTTRYPALSVTKPMVAMAVLRLAERGVLDLDVPLETYLGPFPEGKRAATLHHLLTHTAGLAARGSDVGRPERAAFVRAMKEAPFESAPGTERRYSNAGYSLVAAVIEEVTGKSWQQVVREEVFVPAGMVASGFANDPGAPPVAPGHVGPAHDLRPRRLADGPPALAELWWGAAGAAGVDGTVADLYRWLRAATGGGLLSEASLERAFTPYIGDQGYGWHVDTTPEGEPRRWKGGGLPMYESKVAWYPRRRLTIAYAINDHVGWRVPLWQGLEGVLHGRAAELPPAPRAGVGLPGGLAGVYRLADGGELRLEPERGRLLVVAVDERAVEALGFEGRQAAPGATLAALPIGDGRLAAIRLRPGRAEIDVIELRSGGEAGGLLTVRTGSAEWTASRAAE